jgi:hypothetical protein
MHDIDLAPEVLNLTRAPSLPLAGDALPVGGALKAILD